jgi:hypothetical protein
LVASITLSNIQLPISNLTLLRTSNRVAVRGRP